MKAITLKIIGLVALIGLFPIISRAQISPDNPPEPYVYYKVNVSADRQNVAYTSGGGSYLYGTQVWVNTSLRNSNYTFTHWTADGDTVSTIAGFYFTVGSRNTNLVAHYAYTPVSPSEPTQVLRNRLYLAAEPAGACSFNQTSGQRQVVDGYIRLQAYGNHGFVFQGWYEGEALVSSSAAFNYLMPDHDLTLTARYVYNPANPADPSGTDQTNVKTRLLGDVNKDNVVDVTDAVAVVNSYLENRQDADWLRLADLNGDSLIDVTDAVKVINIYLNQ